MPESNVKALRPEIVEKVVATGVSIGVGLADDRQITFQTGYEGDETDAAVNGRLDRTMRFANRLKAIYSLPALEEDLLKEEMALERFLQDRADIIERYENTQAQRTAELSALRRDAEARHASSDRRGGYKPEGATKRNMEIIAKATLDAEASHAQEHEIATKNHERRLDEIAMKRAKIAKAKALAEG